MKTIVEHTPKPPHVADEYPAWLDNIDIAPDTLPYHLEHPEPTPNAYIRTKNLELGAKVLAKRRIYLDQKYWIYCRDAARGMPQRPIHKTIYDLLRQGVKRGQILCPASHLILEETLKQKDTELRELIAHIVQELSTGITLQPFPVLDRAEILHFFKTTQQRKVNAYPVEQLAWTYVGNVYGHMLPVLQTLDERTVKALQKSWFDLMAHIDFPTLIRALGSIPDGMLHTPAEFYEIQNEQCEAHCGDFSSFQEAFLIELAGGLDVYKPILRECALYLYKTHTGQSLKNMTDEQAKEVSCKFANFIYHAFLLGKIEKQLPGFRIKAGIHAAMRHKGQKYRRGDRHDHLHARVALPYCNLFLTEKSLGYLLHKKPLEYDALYGCRIEWEPEAVVQAIEASIDGGEQPPKHPPYREKC